MGTLHRGAHSLDRRRNFNIVEPCLRVSLNMSTVVLLLFVDVTLGRVAWKDGDVFLGSVLILLVVFLSPRSAHQDFPNNARPERSRPLSSQL